jgi:hypothetical protein
MNHESIKDRAKRVLAYLAVSIFLGGGSVAMATFEPNPLHWSLEVRPLAVLVVFLFFQWLYREKDDVCHKDTHGRVGTYKENKDREEESEKDNVHR